MKFNLGGALITISDEIIEMASTDGHRLSYSYFDFKSETANNVNFIISRKSLLNY